MLILAKRVVWDCLYLLLISIFVRLLTKNKFYELQGR